MRRSYTGITIMVGQQASVIFVLFRSAVCDGSCSGMSLREGVEECIGKCYIVILFMCTKSENYRNI